MANNKQTKTNQPKKDMSKVNNVMKDIFQQLDDETENSKPYV
jgi:hypothetical protein